MSTYQKLNFIAAVGLSLIAAALFFSGPAMAKKSKDNGSCVRIESTSNVAWGVTADHAENRAREKAIEAWKADVFKQRGAESMNMRGDPTFNCSQAGPSNKRRWTCRVSAVACRT